MDLYVILKAIRLELGLSQEEFANRIGMKRSNYSHVEIGRSNLSVEQLNDLAKEFRINISVLFEMLNSKDESLQNFLPKLLTDNTELTKAQVLSPDQSQVSTKKIELQITNNAIQSYVNDVIDIVSIPIIDVSAAAGHGYFNSDNPEQLGEVKLPAVMLQKKYGNYYCGFVRGESMAPTLLHNDYIIFRLLQPDEILMIKDDGVYFIVDSSGASCVKRIKNRLKENNCIICMSDSLDKVNFRDFELKGDEIANMYHVEWRFSRDMTNINDTYSIRLNELEYKVNKLINKE